MHTIINALFLVAIFAFLFYQAQKFRKHSKADFNKFMKVIFQSGIIGIIVFVSFTAFWSGLKHISLRPQNYIVAGVLGVILGVLGGMLVDARRQGKNKGEKPHNKAFNPDAE